MSDASTKPVIFISYAHADEPEKPVEGEVQWLSFVFRYLQPAVKGGIFGVWVDRQMMGGANWDPEIELKLRACDIFILLVSASSMASDYIIGKEIAIIRERQENGEDVYFYPLLLTPTPDAGLDKVRDKNLRPRDAKPFSGFSYHDRLQQMTEAANEIAKIAQRIVERKNARQSSIPSIRRPYVHISGLPETAYERLVGREVNLKRLDEAWADRRTNILSLVEEGGAGKSALVNEWLKNLQAYNYRGAEAVLGWSFYSQGSKDRATSADGFLNWAHDKLEVKLDTKGASAKGEAIADAMARRRVLLVLDGVEPLQHGPGPQVGQLKDLGLRALLRHFAAVTPAEAHGLIVLTSRLAIQHIARWKDSAAPVVDVEKLSDEAGAALLRDNGVWGTDMDLKAASHDFGGHPLALGLLASLLRETQFGDVRRRDHIRTFFADPENPRHDHAKRVMESLEKEWLVDQPVLLAIMHMVGIFDRPASGDCLRVLREYPPIRGFPASITELSDESWNRAVTRLREVRLLAPMDVSARDALDAHPLVREWFGERLRHISEGGWRAAHNRLYEHLRDTTREGKEPTLEDLGPLYQAVAHGCRAGRHQEVLEEIYRERLCRRLAGGSLEYYSLKVLNALGSELATMTWFFAKPYETPISTLRKADQIAVFGATAFYLRAQGRFAEALRAQNYLLNELQPPFDRKYTSVKVFKELSRRMEDLARMELLVGQIADARASASRSVEAADSSGDGYLKIVSRATLADVLLVSGQWQAAEPLLAYVSQQMRQLKPNYKLGCTIRLLLHKGDWLAVCDWAAQALNRARKSNQIFYVSVAVLTLGQAAHGLALNRPTNQKPESNLRKHARVAHASLYEAVEGLRSAGAVDRQPHCLLARAALRRSLGNWDNAARDLDEVEEIAELGPMRLYQCDMALERARLCFARIEAFAPLNGMLENNPPKPIAPDTAEAAFLTAEARANLAEARTLITDCSYHWRDEELVELEAVLAGSRRFADLPPRV